MSRIRGKDTAPEKVVRSLLHRMGFRFEYMCGFDKCLNRSAATFCLSTERRDGDLRAVSVDIVLPKI
jgi:hypothetical protein